MKKKSLIHLMIFTVFIVFSIFVWATADGQGRAKGNSCMAECIGDNAESYDASNELTQFCQEECNVGTGAGACLTSADGCCVPYTDDVDCCIDDDKDGYGLNGRPACTFSGLDCNDNNVAINPSATELCNGLDDDCDGQVDEGVSNACGTCGDVPPEVCDGVDNDCNGLVDDDCSVYCSVFSLKDLSYEESLYGSGTLKGTTTSCGTYTSCDYPDGKSWPYGYFVVGPSSGPDAGCATPEGMYVASRPNFVSEFVTYAEFEACRDVLVNACG